MATYYVDYDRGSDSNNGTSMSTPWKLPQKIDDAAKAAGDQILFEESCTWPASVMWANGRVVPPTSWTGTESNPVVIGKYSRTGRTAGRKPTFEWHHETATTDWTETATSNVWLYSNPNSYTFTNSCLIRLNDTWDASCVDEQSTAALIGASGVVGRYFATGTTLWLYAPSNPVTYFGSVKLSPGATGLFSLTTNTNWITIQDLHFEETACGVLTYSGGAGVASFRVQRISGRTVSNLIAANADAGGNLRTWIDDCDIVDFGPLAIITAGSAGFEQVEITNNRIHDGVRCWAQSGIYVNGRTTGFSALIRGNHVSKCRWGSKGKSLDGSGIYVESGANNARVIGNLIEDCYVAMQDNSGRANTWKANFVRRCRIAIRITDQSGNEAMNHVSYNNTFIVGDTTQAPTEFGGTQGQEYTGFWIYKATGNATVTATNNLIVDVTGSNFGCFGLPAVAGTLALNGNWISGYQYDTQRTETPATTGSLTKLGTANPNFGNGFLPSNSACYNVGASVGGIDFFGKEMPNPCNAGAVENWPSRSVATRSVASRSAATRSAMKRRAISGV